MFLTGGETAAADAATAVEEEAPTVVPTEVHYYNIQPEFVVNFKGKSKLKFLMIEMAAATTDEKATAVIDDHTPELRNNLLMLLAEQDAEVLKTSEGKEALREQSHTIIEELVTRHYGPGRVAEVFFTRFVMQ